MPWFRPNQADTYLMELDKQARAAQERLDQEGKTRCPECGMATLKEEREGSQVVWTRKQINL